MTNHENQFHLIRWFTRFFAPLVLFSFTASAKYTQIHLFILSGQSNMTGDLKASFAKKVEETYGKENIVVVHHSKGGRGIRFWDKDYRFPDSYRFPGKGVPAERSKQQHGQEYAQLIDKVREAIKGKSFSTITFVWMQGESDGGRGLGAVYEESFRRLMDRLKKDLNHQDIGFVIGRINDARISDPNWKQEREVQVKLAEDSSNGKWIDTDDLSAPKNGVHFPKENYQKIGQRFAQKAIELIRKKKELQEIKEQKSK